MGRPIITERDVLEATDELRIPRDAIVTELARDTARKRSVRLVTATGTRIACNLRGRLPLDGIGPYVESLSRAVDDETEIRLFVPALHLVPFGRLLRERGPNLLFGPQATSPRPPGARTGETSLDMVVDCGAQLILVGHPDRRLGWGREAARRIDGALQRKLRPHLCLPETRRERERARSWQVLVERLGATLQHVRSSDLTGLAICLLPDPTPTATPSGERTASLLAHLRQKATHFLGAGRAAPIQWFGGPAPIAGADGLFVDDDRALHPDTLPT